MCPFTYACSNLLLGGTVVFLSSVFGLDCWSMCEHTHHISRLGGEQTLTILLLCIFYVFIWSIYLCFKNAHFYSIWQLNAFVFSNDVMVWCVQVFISVHACVYVRVWQNLYVHPRSHCHILPYWQIHIHPIWYFLMAIGSAHILHTSLQWLYLFMWHVYLLTVALETIESNSSNFWEVIDLATCSSICKKKYL